MIPIGGKYGISNITHPKKCKHNYHCIFIIKIVIPNSRKFFLMFYLPICMPANWFKNPVRVLVSKIAFWQYLIILKNTQNKTIKLFQNVYLLHCLATAISSFTPSSDKINLILLVHEKGRHLKNDIRDQEGATPVLITFEKSSHQIEFIICSLVLTI